jgi:hypothetical protein
MFSCSKEMVKGKKGLAVPRPQLPPVGLDGEREPRGGGPLGQAGDAGRWGRRPVHLQGAGWGSAIQVLEWMWQCNAGTGVVVAVR